MERPPPQSNRIGNLFFHQKIKKNMKSIYLKISVFVLLLAIVGAGCEKEEDLSYLDNKTPLTLGNLSFPIYRTKKDYFYNVSVTPMQDYIYSPELSANSSSITLYKGRYYYLQRFRLSDNYIVGGDIGVKSYFTNLSYDDYIKEGLAPKVGVTNPKVIASIVDRDPFTEFYISPKSFNGKGWITLDEINQLIKEKKLEVYFTKIK